MIDFYRELIESEDCEVEFVFLKRCKTILDYTKDVLACDIHIRDHTVRLLSELGANIY